jgi:hypothetical protein
MPDSLCKWCALYPLYDEFRVLNFDRATNSEQMQPISALQIYQTSFMMIYFSILLLKNTIHISDSFEDAKDISMRVNKMLIKWLDLV